MELNPARLATLKAAILAETDATLVNRRNRRDTGLIAAWYAGASSVVVWKPSVSKDDVLERCAGDIDALTAARKTTLSILLTGDTVACNRPAVRNAFTSLFPVGDETTTGAKLIALFQRFANRAEAVFATGGAGTAIDPHRLVVEGSPTNENIVDALNS